MRSKIGTTFTGQTHTSPSTVFEFQNKNLYKKMVIVRWITHVKSRNRVGVMPVCMKVCSCV